MATQKTQTGDRSAPQKVVEKGHRQYLIVPRRGSQAARAAIQPLSAAAMKGLIANIPQVEVVRVLRPKKVVSTFSATPDESNETYVVKMDRNRAELLKQSAPPHLIVEQDRFLDYGGMVSPPTKTGPVRPLRATEGLRVAQLKFRVLGDGDAPMANTKVTLQGDAFAQDGVTDKNGEVTLAWHAVGENAPRSLFVDPMRDYWDRYILTPDVSTKEVNIVRMISLKQSLTGFPGSYKYGWGQRLMGLDQLPSGLTGKGVKIAIIDSGADKDHPLLRHLQKGKDMTNNQNEESWSRDLVGHGTHCAGIITGRGSDQVAFHGFAPDAEVYVFKIFPGGQFSSLLDALDECMALDIDIVNMSLGSDQISQAVEQKLEEAVHDGIACIVAAGNSGGPVQYPASSPNVLAVSAIGKLKEYPSESWDARTVIQNAVTQEGIFSPSFTCFGPQIGVSAPGVSIVSSVPDNGFEPQSGTSMAAPHVTGFAALLLAHHPVFQTQARSRGPQRVATLFQLIKQSCAPVQLGPGRTGCGVPRLQGLLNVLKAPSSTASAPSATPSNQPAPAPGAGHTNGKGATVTAEPPPSAPPNIDPQVWQTIVLPQLMAWLASQGGWPLLTQLAQQGLSPETEPLASLLASLLGRSPVEGFAPFRAAPGFSAQPMGDPISQFGANWLAHIPCQRGGLQVMLGRAHHFAFAFAFTFTSRRSKENFITHITLHINSAKRL